MNKTKIYLIRHGQSQGNEKGLLLGHTDLDLTELGYEQAQKTATFLHDVPVDAIYSSDLLRAYHTALATANDKGLSVTRDRELREIFLGDWEGAVVSDLREGCPAEFDVWRENFGRVCPPNGETPIEVQERVMRAVLRLCERHKGQTIFLFSHGAAIRVLKAACDGKSPDEIKDVPWATNASVSTLEYEDGTLRCTEYSRDDFLQGMTTEWRD